jgi:hypothetical protein
MDMRNVRHQVEAQEWQKRILAHRSSSLSVKQWCADNNVRENRYYYWLHVLRNEELLMNKPAGIFAELQLQSKNQNYDRVTTGICAVIHGSGLCLEIHNGADPTTLEAAMRTLGVGR